MNLHLLLISLLGVVYSHPVWDVSQITENITELDDVNYEPMVEGEDNRGVLELVQDIIEGKINIKCATGQGQEGRCSVGRCANLKNATAVSCPGKLSSFLICCPVKPVFETTPDKVQDCGVRPLQTSNLIVGGEEAIPHSWPWAIALYRVSDDRKYFQCGGSIISSRYILTAAHCIKRPFETLTAKDFVVKVGAHYLASSGEFVEAEEIIAHENYSPSYHNDDIALIRLKSALNFEDTHLAPVCLPGAGSLTGREVGQMATMVGWGVHDQNEFDSSSSLYEVKVPVSKKDECEKAYTELMGSNDFFKWDNVVCAGLEEGGKDTCKGDSGGPMVMSDANDVYSQFGVVSFGYGCAQKGYAGVYTYVPNYLNWIAAHMKV